MSSMLVMLLSVASLIPDPWQSCGDPTPLQYLIHLAPLLTPGTCVFNGMQIEFEIN